MKAGVFSAVAFQTLCWLSVHVAGQSSIVGGPYNQQRTQYSVNQQSNNGYRPANPGYQQPNARYRPANPGYQQPNTGYRTANPGYQQPNTVYRPANPGYQQPNTGYGSANPGYQQPNTGYRPANPGFQQPIPHIDPHPVPHGPQPVPVSDPHIIPHANPQVDPHAGSIPIVKNPVPTIITANTTNNTHFINIGVGQSSPFGGVQSLSFPKSGNVVQNIPLPNTGGVVQSLPQSGEKSLFLINSPGTGNNIPFANPGNAPLNVPLPSTGFVPHDTHDVPQNVPFGNAPQNIPIGNPGNIPPHAPHVQTHDDPHNDPISNTNNVPHNLPHDNTHNVPHVDVNGVPHASDGSHGSPNQPHIDIHLYQHDPDPDPTTKPTPGNVYKHNNPVPRPRREYYREDNTRSRHINSPIRHNFFSGFDHNANFFKTHSCPRPKNLAANIMFSSLGAGYPIGDIQYELQSRPNVAHHFLQALVNTNCPLHEGDRLHPNLVRCLMKESLQRPNLSTKDYVRMKAKSLCPIIQHRLWSFQGYRDKQRCWLLQGFQDVVRLAKCRTLKCNGCGGYDFGYETQNICIPGFEEKTLLVYCQGEGYRYRIQWKKVIVPNSCACKRLTCGHTFGK